MEVCSVQTDPSRRHIDVMQGEAAVGRILLRTTSSPEQVKKLQSVQVRESLQKQSIAELQSEKILLARQVEDSKTKRKRFQEDIRDSLDELQRQALDIGNETPLQQFLVATRV